VICPGSIASPDFFIFMRFRLLSVMQAVGLFVALWCLYPVRREAGGGWWQLFVFLLFEFLFFGVIGYFAKFMERGGNSNFGAVLRQAKSGAFSSLILVLLCIFIRVDLVGLALMFCIMEFGLLCGEKLKGGFYEGS
jgi:hypothetical protein